MKEKFLYDGFHKILEVDAVVKDKKVKREKLLLKNAVAGIVTDENNRVALVTQYRPVPGKMTKEIPAGVMDKPGLTPLETLIEELEEECEIPKSDILSASDVPLHEYFMIVGSSDARIGIYEIKVKAQKSKKVADVDVENVEWVDLDAIRDLIMTGHIVDGKTLLAYYYLSQKNR